MNYVEYCLRISVYQQALKGAYGWSTRKLIKLKIDALTLNYIRELDKTDIVSELLGKDKDKKNQKRDFDPKNPFKNMTEIK